MTGLSLSLQGSCKYNSASKEGVCKYVNQSACGFTLAFNRLRWAPAGDTSNPRQSALLRRKLCAGPDCPVTAEEVENIYTICKWSINMFIVRKKKVSQM